MSSAQNYIFQGLAMLFLPQTPQYLMIKKRDTQAEAIIKKLKLSTNVRQTMTDIRLNLTEESNASLCQAENNMNGRMLIGIGLVMAQQLTGTDFGNVYNFFQCFKISPLYWRFWRSCAKKLLYLVSYSSYSTTLYTDLGTPI